MSDSSSKTHAKHALDVSATKRRKGEVAGKAGKSAKAYHASHGTAQKRIKKSLKIGNKVDGDAYSAMGRCLDEATAAIIARWINLAGPKDSIDGSAASAAGTFPTLTPQIALSGIFSIIPPEQHTKLVDFVQDALDAYHGVPAQ